MDQAALVSIDLEQGAKVLDALDKSDLEISVALWLHLSEYGDWRLGVSSRKLDGVDRLSAYGLIRKALDAQKVTVQNTPPVMIFRMTDPMIKSLRKAYSKVRDVKGTRLGGQPMGDRFLESAYIYRIR